MKDLIKHILGNANAYISEYKEKEQLTDIEKGILKGLYYDVDSIINHLETEKMDATIETQKEIDNILKELHIKSILEELRTLYN